MNNLRKADRIFGLLGEIPAPERTAHFDKRFWARFETERIPSQTLQGPMGLLKPMIVLSSALSLCLAGWLGLATVLDKPRVSLTHGHVVVQGEQSERALTKGQGLQVGDTVTTGPSDWMILELEGGYRIQIQPDSTLMIEQLKSQFLPGKSVFHLSRGKALIKIGLKEGDRYPLEVSTSNAIAKAKGTQFSVTAPVQAGQFSQVSVLEGTVEVGRFTAGRMIPESSVAVHSGQEISVSETNQILTPRKMVERKRRVLEELFQFGHRDQAILLIGMDAGRMHELLKPAAIYLHFESSREDIHAIKTIIHAMSQARELNTAREMEALRRLEELVDHATALDRIPVYLFIASYYSHLGSHEEAVRVFESVASEHPFSSYRSLALMAAAWIYHHRLAEDVQALHRVNEILEKHPQSLEFAEAQRLQRRIHAVSSDASLR